VAEERIPRLPKTSESEGRNYGRSATQREGRLSMVPPESMASLLTDIAHNPKGMETSHPV